MVRKWLICIGLVSLLAMGFYFGRTSMKPSVETESTLIIGEKQSIVESKKTESVTSMTETELKVTESVENKLPPKLTSQITKVLKRYNSPKLGISIKFLDTGETFDSHGDKIFYGASIAKLPTILYTLEKIEKKELNLTDTFPYTSVVNDIPGGMVIGGTGSLQGRVTEGQLVTVEELLTHAIKESDNLANNMLGYYVGEMNGQAFLRSIAPYYPKGSLKTFDKNLSARTAMNLMIAIYNFHSADEWFKHTNWPADKIGVLPAPVLHKIGMNGAYNHDVAIVEGDHTYALSILTDGYSNAQIEAIALELHEIITN